MRKMAVMFVIFTGFILLFSGCGSKENPDIAINQANNQPKKDAADTVIDRHGQVENLDRLDTFVENVQSSLKDNIRLTRYTIEGDPIYHDLDFDGTNLTFTLDTTEDKYGHGSVTTYKCKKVTKYESNTETNYTIEGCPEGDGELLYISHDVEKEDYFAFHLTYGEGKDNEINTKEQIMTKALKNGEMVTISDFQLSTQQMNKIYKEMVLANYLIPKSLSSSCNEKTFESYELTVWINSAEKNFKWTSCDQTEDDRAMTNLVENIIRIAEENL